MDDSGEELLGAYEQCPNMGIGFRHRLVSFGASRSQVLLMRTTNVSTFVSASHRDSLHTTVLCLVELVELRYDCLRI